MIRITRSSRNDLGGIALACLQASSLRLDSPPMCLRRVIKVALTSAFVAGAAVASTGSASADAPRATWEKIAKCESGGNWQIDTGNGYYGGPQFALATWHEYGGTGMPQDASKDEQIRVAERVLRSQGWAAWPMCSRKLGLR